jgi:hypothetical protein
MAHDADLNSLNDGGVRGIRYAETAAFFDDVTRIIAGPRLLDCNERKILSNHAVTLASGTLMAGAGPAITRIKQQEVDAQICAAISASPGIG